MKVMARPDYVEKDLRTEKRNTKRTWAVKQKDRQPDSKKLLTEGRKGPLKEPFQK